MNKRDKNYNISNKAKVIGSLSFLVMSISIIAAFILDADVKFYLLIFLAVGFGLAFLRMFVNSMIKKMKGKPIYIKIAFFVVLLSVGLPFQNWFRKDVILAMSSNYILPCLVVAISSMIFTTITYGVIYQNKRLKGI